MSRGDETELIAQCRRGEPAAWDALFDAHYAAVGRFVLQLAPDFSREDTAEICQEVFLAVIQKLGAFQGQSRLQTWLFRIAANHARDFRQRRQAAKRGAGREPLSLHQEGPEGEALIDPPAGAPGPDALLLSRERQELLVAALDELGEPCREVIQLRYFGELSYEEVGAALALNPKTVSSRLSHCLKELAPMVTALFSGAKRAANPSNS